ncbi:hypothetical protein CBM2623_A10103 [Cupriavidus taiwanensis]|nr:hypothetical protein CBM2623_A10103 [Cupriavidus taiwanensis]
MLVGLVAEPLVDPSLRFTAEMRVELHSHYRFSILLQAIEMRLGYRPDAAEVEVWRRQLPKPLAPKDLLNASSFIQLPVDLRNLPGAVCNRRQSQETRQGCTLMVALQGRFGSRDSLRCAALRFRLPLELFALNNCFSPQREFQQGGALIRRHRCAGVDVAFNEFLIEYLEIACRGGPCVPIERNGRTTTGSLESKLNSLVACRTDSFAAYFGRT